MLPSTGAIYDKSVRVGAVGTVGDIDKDGAVSRLKSVGIVDTTIL